MKDGSEIYQASTGPSSLVVPNTTRSGEIL
jgi:hypothetical protein